MAGLLPEDALKTEWDVGMFKDGISGVYPIAGKWGETHAFDVKLRCGFQALRVDHLIKTTVAPKLKEATANDPNGHQIWVDAAGTGGVLDDALAAYRMFFLLSLRCSSHGR